MSSVGKLAGKVALVTASTSGIGLAIARRLGVDGAKVVVSSRRQKNVDNAVDSLKSEGLDAFGLVCHNGKEDDMKRLISETVLRNDGIDILVSSVAVNPFVGPILESTGEHWDKIFDVNVKSVFLLCKEVVPHMKLRGGGSILINSSLAGYTNIENIGPYCVSKTALFGLVKALAPQCASLNIRVNGLAPGLIDTCFGNVLTSDPVVGGKIIEQTLLKRVGRPEECAGIASFLSSDDASFITGETIVIGGGFPSRL